MPTQDSFLFPRTTAEFLTPDGRYQVGRLCKRLGVGPAEFARLVSRSTESVAKLFGEQAVAPKDEGTVRVLRELLEVAALLHSLGLSEEEASRWMHAPVVSFEGRTPQEIIAAGNGRELIGRLLAFASGNVGA